MENIKDRKHKQVVAGFSLRNIEKRKLKLAVTKDFCSSFPRTVSGNPDPRRFLACTLSLILAVSPLTTALADDTTRKITLTTYYPAPFGSYERVQAGKGVKPDMAGDVALQRQLRIGKSQTIDSSRNLGQVVVNLDVELFTDGIPGNEPPGYTGYNYDTSGGNNNSYVFYNGDTFWEEIAEPIPLDNDSVWTGPGLPLDISVAGHSRISGAGKVTIAGYVDVLPWDDVNKQGGEITLKSIPSNWAMDVYDGEWRLRHNVKTPFDIYKTNNEDKLFDVLKLGSDGNLFAGKMYSNTSNKATADLVDINTGSLFVATGALIRSNKGDKSLWDLYDYDNNTETDGFPDIPGIYSIDDSDNYDLTTNFVTNGDNKFLWYTEGMDGNGNPKETSTSREMVLDPSKGLAIKDGRLILGEDTSNADLKTEDGDGILEADEDGMWKIYSDNSKTLKFRSVDSCPQDTPTKDMDVLTLSDEGNLSAGGHIMSKYNGIDYDTDLNPTSSGKLKGALLISDNIPNVWGFTEYINVSETSFKMFAGSPDTWTNPDNYYLKTWRDINDKVDPDGLSGPLPSTSLKKLESSNLAIPYGGKIQMRPHGDMEGTEGWSMMLTSLPNDSKDRWEDGLEAWELRNNVSTKMKVGMESDNKWGRLWTQGLVDVNTINIGGRDNGTALTDGYITMKSMSADKEINIKADYETDATSLLFSDTPFSTLPPDKINQLKPSESILQIAIDEINSNRFIKIGTMSDIMLAPVKDGDMTDTDGDIYDGNEKGVHVYGDLLIAKGRLSDNSVLGNDIKEDTIMADNMKGHGSDWNPSYAPSNPGYDPIYDGQEVIVTDELGNDINYYPVTNLNTDFLDGYSSEDFFPASVACSVHQNEKRADDTTANLGSTEGGYKLKVDPEKLVSECIARNMFSGIAEPNQLAVGSYSTGTGKYCRNVTNSADPSFQWACVTGPVSHIPDVDTKHGMVTCYRGTKCCYGATVPQGETCGGDGIPNEDEDVSVTAWITGSWKPTDEPDPISHGNNLDKSMIAEATIGGWNIKNGDIKVIDIDMNGSDGLPQDKRFSALGNNTTFANSLGENTDYFVPKLADNAIFGNNLATNDTFGPALGANLKFGQSLGPLIGEKLEFKNELGNNYDFGTTLGANLKFGQSLAPLIGKELEFQTDLGNNEDFATVLGSNNSAFASNLGARIGTKEAFRSDLENNAKFKEALGDNDFFAKTLGTRPEFGEQLGQNIGLEQPVIGSEFISDIAKNPNFGPALGSNPNFGTKIGASLGNEPSFADVVGSKDNFKDNLAENTTFAKAVALNSTFGDIFADKLGDGLPPYDNFTTELANNDDFAAKLGGNANFVNAIAPKLAVNDVFASSIGISSHFLVNLAKNTAFAIAIALNSTFGDIFADKLGDGLPPYDNFTTELANNDKFAAKLGANAKFASSEFTNALLSDDNFETKLVSAIQPTLTIRSSNIVDKEIREEDFAESLTGALVKLEQVDKGIPSGAAIAGNNIVDRVEVADVIAYAVVYDPFTQTKKKCKVKTINYFTDVTETLSPVPYTQDDGSDPGDINDHYTDTQNNLTGIPGAESMLAIDDSVPVPCVPIYDWI